LTVLCESLTGIGSWKSLFPFASKA
jgi:hypothetical protein